MNILIVLPYSYFQNPSMGYPIGLFYIARALKSGGNNIYWLEYPDREPSDTEIEADITKLFNQKKIQIAMCGSLASAWRDLEKIFRAVKCVAAKLGIDCHCVGGGGLFTYSSHEAMELCPSVDVGVIGEGEITVNEVVKALQSGLSISELHGVDGIIFRDKFHKPIKTIPGKIIENFDNLPYPLLSPKFEEWVIKNRTASICISRSCPFACTFCATSTVRKYRKRPVDDVVAEIQYMQKKYDVKQFTFVDELFILEESRIVEFCKKIKPLNIQFVVQTRPSKILTEKVFRILREVGATSFCFGVENINDDILNSMNKKTTRALLDYCFNEAEKAGVSAMLNFNLLYGDPAETIDTASENLKFYFENCDKYFFVQNANIINFPGSILYNHCLKNGLINNSTDYIRKGMPYLNMTTIPDEKRQALSCIIYAADFIKDTVVLNRISDFKIYRQSPKKIPFVEYRCSCNAHNQMITTQTNQLLTVNNYVTCFECKKMVASSVNFAIIHFISSKIIDYIQGKKVAFWGIGGFRFMKLVQFFYKLDNIVLIDNNVSFNAEDFKLYEEKSGLTPIFSKFFSRVIYRQFPINENIDVVIEFTIGSNQEIAAEVRKHSNIPVISVNDFIPYEEA